jgi:hypothetical protein
MLPKFIAGNGSMPGALARPPYGRCGTTQALIALTATVQGASVRLGIAVQRMCAPIYWQAGGARRLGSGGLGVQ